jgi:hypothetical protein
MFQNYINVDNYLNLPQSNAFSFFDVGVASCFGDWRWGLRVTPFMGLVSILLIIFFMIDPERGLSDGAQESISRTSVSAEKKIFGHILFHKFWTKLYRKRSD